MTLEKFKEEFIENLKESPMKALADYHPIYIPDKFNTEKYRQEYSEFYYPIAVNILSDNMGSLDDLLWGSGQEVPTPNIEYKLHSEDVNILEDETLERVRKYNLGNNLFVGYDHFSMGGKIMYSQHVKCADDYMADMIYNIWS